jgi:hypothetical protein
MNSNIDRYSAGHSIREPIAGPPLLAQILQSGLSGPECHVQIGRIVIYETLFNRWLVEHRSDFSLDELTDIVVRLDDLWGNVSREWQALSATAAMTPSEQNASEGAQGANRDERLSKLRAIVEESGVLPARDRLENALAAVADCYRGERHRDRWLAGFSLDG